MERQLSHMVRLIDDLLDIARISLNKLQLRRARVALADVVSSAVETARPNIDGAEHHLEVLLPPEPVLLDADWTRLAQVLGNLLTRREIYAKTRSNYAASRAPGRLRGDLFGRNASASSRSRYVHFDMFSQVDHSFERTTGGSVSAWRWCRLDGMHGGSVRAESPGPGWESFHRALPWWSRPTSSGRRQPPRPRGSRRRILVVDDNGTR